MEDYTYRVSLCMTWNLCSTGSLCMAIGNQFTKYSTTLQSGILCTEKCKSGMKIVIPKKRLSLQIWSLQPKVHAYVCTVKKILALFIHMCLYNFLLNFHFNKCTPIYPNHKQKKIIYFCSNY